MDPNNDNKAPAQPAPQQQAAPDTEFPESFICPLTHEVMNDPVVDHEGNSYERAAIENWLKSHATSPITRAPLTKANLAPNRALRDAISEKKKALGLPVQDLPPIERLEISDKDKGKAVDSTTPVPGANEDGIALSVSATRAQTQTVGAGEEELLVHVSVRPPEGATRTPVDICCVVDVSGSMGEEAKITGSGGEKESHGLSLLDITKHAVKTVIQAMLPTDRVSLIKYSTSASTVFRFLDMDEEGKKKAMDLVEALHPEDSTNIWDGLHTGLELIRKESQAGRVAALLLLTDGLPNVSPPRGELQTLVQYREKSGLPHLPCTINTFGFGYNINCALLNSIALEGQGMYVFIPESSFVGTAFVNSVTNMLVTLGKHATLDLEPMNNARILDKGVVGMEHTKTSWGAQVHLSSIQFGQSRDIVVRVAVPAGFSADQAYLAATLKYTHWNASEGSVAQMTAEGTRKDGDASLIYEHFLRLTFAQEVMKATAAFQLNNVAAQKDIKDLADIITAHAGGNAHVSKLGEDVTGQVTEAFSKKEFFSRWGQRYLYSLVRAHAMQQCNNFKDPGIQHYGGKLFNDLREEVEAIFVKLPPPKPSVARSSGSRSFGGGGGSRAAAAPVSMSSYYSSSTPCFAGECLVTMWDGSLKRVDAITKGDRIMTPSNRVPATVRCVIKTHCAQGRTRLVTLQNGLKITPYHPVRVDGSWYFPCELVSDVEAPCAAVYSFVLDVVSQEGAEHVMLINGVACVTLGHTFQEEVVRHAYFGSTRVIDDLGRMRGWDRGLIEFSGEGQGCMKRNESGLVIGFFNEIAL
eukprot:TRINITY_DN1168_c0_g1_i2.p1 TRINITY_DN1168_c0_g1~~TRINITY_DN1168_c0_g1_i2.p1  ORF type:complete len:809 (+),score=247.47 TRINITY_DN1168_c0_g1_i2:121-2547(+)